MRKLLWLVIAAAAIWSGYWFAAATGIERGLQSWLDARQAENWQAEASEIAVSGYPANIETTLRDLALADPETGLAWTAPVFHFAAPAHAPTRVTATWPGEQTVSSPFERITIASETMVAGLGLDGGLSLTLDTSDVTLRDITLTSSRGWKSGLAEGTLTTRRLADTPLAHDIRFIARDVTPADRVLDRLDPAGLLPPTIAGMDVAAIASFDTPWDRRAIEDRRPQPRALALDRLEAQWGDMKLAAAGDLTMDEAGIPTGRITLRAENWRDMVAVLRSAGVVPEGLLPTVERGLGLLAGLSGSPDTIDAPLSFQNGFMSLGPVPLGPAPRIVIR